MKYFVFTLAAFGVPPLAFLLYINKRWQKYAFWAMMGAMMLYNATSINFLSEETYPGTSRGMEVSVIHLFAFAILISLKLQGKLAKFIPETGFRLYLIYFLLCMPSLSAACDYKVAWFEIWKMILLYFFYLSVYTYLKATDDVKSVLKGFAFYAIINLLMVMKDSLYSFFEKEKTYDYTSAFVADLSSNSYTFSNIGNLISLMYRNKFTGEMTDPDWLKKHPNWNKVVIVPIASNSVTVTTSASIVFSLCNEMGLSSTQLEGGPHTPIEVEVIYAKFKDR